MGMSYTDFLGYYPTAPVVSGVPNITAGVGTMSPNTDSTPNLIAAASGNSVSFSGDFSIAGWLVVIVIGLAAYRILWEMGE